MRRRPIRSTKGWRSFAIAHMSTRFSSVVVMTLARTTLFVLLALPLAAQSVDRLAGKNVSIAQTNYKGQNAIQVIAKAEAANGTSYALVKDVSFGDDVIEVDLAGQPRADAGAGARGFIGIAFRSTVTGLTSTFICGPRMAGPTIKSGGTTPPNTVRIRILTTPGRGRRLLNGMSRTSICSCGSDLARKATFPI